jgi:hypothetical protein
VDATTTNFTNTTQQNISFTIEGQDIIFDGDPNDTGIDKTFNINNMTILQNGVALSAGAIGVIASGSGANYSITPDGGGDAVNAVLPNASAAAMIPVGTTVIYLNIGGVNYIVNIPVWL